MIPNGFPKDLFLNFVDPPEVVPEDTLRMLGSSRGRCQAVLDFLALPRGPGVMHFRISKIVQLRLNKFSQVFFGHLEWTPYIQESSHEISGSNQTQGTNEARDEQKLDESQREQCPEEICLKMFDYSLFPLEEIVRMVEYVTKPHTEWKAYSLASEMMQREHAVYTRLANHQGTLLPHAYGFHQASDPL